MNVVAMILVAAIAAIHVYIMVLEMFLWERRGPKVFANFDADLFPRTTQLAFNQGAYNGVLAAGLIWSLFISTDDWQRNVATFFLLAVAAMGVVGAATADRKIVFVQTVPAVLALIAVWV